MILFMFMMYNAVNRILISIINELIGGENP